MKIFGIIFILLSEHFRCVGRNDFFHDVHLVKKKLYCDCGDDIYQGAPCRHILAIVVKDQGAKQENLCINKRWGILYYVEKSEDKEPEKLSSFEDEEIENNQDIVIFSLFLLI